MSAVNNVNLMAANISNQGQITSAMHDVLIQTANMTNSGLIQSMRGNVEISNLLQASLAVNNLAGTISADHTLSFINSVRGGEINVCGGKLLGDQIDFTVKGGAVHVALEDISSNVGFSSRSVLLDVAHGTHGLSLSGVNRAYSVGLSYNGTGDINTTGFKTRGQDVSLITSNGSVSVSGNINTTPASGAAGDVFISAGLDMSLRKVDTRGAKSGDGGSITLIGGEDITAKALNSSGGKNGGAPGFITIHGGLSGNGDVTLASATAGSNGGIITITTPDLISVKGALNAPGGQVILSAHETKIGKVDVGHGEIDIIPAGENGTFVLDYSQLVAFGESNVVIGSSGNVNADIVIRNDCNNCLHNLDSLQINTSGSFTATGTTLTLDPDMSFEVNAGSGIYTGSVQGGSYVSFVSGGNLVVDGTIHASSEGSVVLGGTNITISGSVQAVGGDVTLLPGSSATAISGSSLSHITADSITIGSGGASQGVVLTGTANLSNLSSFDVNLGGAYNAANSVLTFGESTPVNILAGSITSGTISGSNQVTLDTPGNLVVAGTISTPAGSVVLSGGQISIPGAIVSNTVQLLPSIGGSVIDATGFSHVTADTLSIGNGGGTGNVTLTGSANLSHVDNFVVDLGGSLDAGSSRLTFENGTTVSISSANLVVGALSGSTDLALNAVANLVIQGPVESEHVVLSGANIGIPGSVTANTVVLLPTAGNTTVQASGLANITADSVTIGSGSGTNSVIVTGTAALTNVGQLSISLGGGSYNAQNSNLTFNEDTKVTIEAANIVTGSMSGAAQVVLETHGNLTVDGDLHSTQVTLAGGNVDIPGSVTANTVLILPESASTTVSAAGLGNISAEQLTIGSGQGSNALTIVGQGDLSGVGNFSVNLGGNYDGSGSSLSFNDHASVGIFAQNIITGGMSGAATVNLNTPGTVTVGGAGLGAGSVVLGGSAIVIDSNINVGSGNVTIIPGANKVELSASGLSKITAGTLTLGNGTGSNSVTLTGAGNLSDVSGAVNVNLGGNFDGAGSSLVLAGGTPVSISAANITTGELTGAGQVRLATAGSLTIGGDLTATGVVLGGSTIAINNDISVGSGMVAILPGAANTILQAGDLAHISAGTLSVGNGTGTNSVTILGSGELTGLSNFSVNLGGGGFDSSNASLQFGGGTAVSVVAANITSGAISGASQIYLVSAGELDVAGALSTNSGRVVLAGNAININAGVNAGNAAVVLMPGTGTLNLDASQLANITAGALQIGNGEGTRSATITGSANLSGIAGPVSVNLPRGNFDAGSSQLTFNAGSDVSIVAASVTTGRMNGAGAVSVTASGALNVQGNIDTTGAVNLAGDTLGLGSGVRLGNIEVHGGSVSVSSAGGDITSGANITSVREIHMQSGGGLAILDSSNLHAGTDLRLDAVGTVRVGSDNGAGAVLTAGQLSLGTDPFSLTEPVNTSAIVGTGSVLINTYQDGHGTGDIVLGSNTGIAAAGSPGHAGDVGLLSAVDINIGTHSTLSSVGGDLWLSAGDDVSVGQGTKLTSIAVSNGPASVIQGNPVPVYSGGRIGVLAGAPQTNMSQLLASMSSARTSANSVSLPYGPAWGSSNTVNASGGASLQVIFPAAATKSVTDSNLMLSGGVIYLDPPDAGNSVSFSGVTLTAIAPRIMADTPILPPITNGGGSGSTGNTAGGGTILPPGSILSSSPIFSNSFSSGSGSITSSDVTAAGGRRESLSFAGFSGLSLTGPSAFPSDTLESENPKKQNNLRQAVFCTAPVVLKPKERVDEDSWIVASSSCQPFTFEAHDGSLIVGSGPAKFAPAADRTLLLKEGKILVMTVDKIHIVKTPICTATIPVNTAAIVEYQPDGAAYITNLAGGKASVTLCKNDETCILTAAPGEQMILADAECPDEKIQGLSYAGVASQNVNNWHVELSGLRGRKMSYDRQELALQEWLLSCSNRCVNQAQLRRIQQLMQSMSSTNATAPTLKSMAPRKKQGLIKNIAMAPESSTSALSEFSPVSYVTGGMAAAVHINTLGAPTASVRYTGKSSVAMESPGILNFTDGEIMVSATAKTLVKAGPALIHFSPGAVAVLSLRNGMLKVRNVYEKAGTGIKACLPGRKCLGVQAGQEIILGPKGLTLTKALSDEPVGRRRLTSVDLPTGHTFICSEISLSSFMQNSSVLSQVMRSPNPADRALAEKIMKMAVCLSVVTSSHGNYSITSQ